VAVDDRQLSIAMKWSAICRLLYSYLVGAPADRDCRWRESRPIHRRAVTERGGFLARVTNVIQLFVPALDVRAVRRLFAPGDGNVTVLRECEKGGFARQRNRRGPVR